MIDMTEQPDDSALKTEKEYYNRSLAALSRGDSDGFIAEISKAIELNQKHAFAFLHLRGEAKKRKGDLAGADADFAQSAKLKASTRHDVPDQRQD